MNFIEDTSYDLLKYFIPIFVISLILETLFILFIEKQHYNYKDSVASVFMGIVNAFINNISKSVFFLIFVFLYQYRIFEFEFNWWYFVLLFCADDLSFYLHHRSCHQIRIFWAAHVNHHSSVYYNFAVALRQSWTEVLFKYIWWIWLPILGFHPVHIMWMILISLFYQFFLHVEWIKKLWILEYIFNTPSHHRVHHGSNMRYLDKNHGGILIIWDRLLGTFQKELPEESVVFGITSNINSYNPLYIATHEFVNLWNDIKKTKSFTNKLKYLVCPPGWSANSDSKTVKQMREENTK